MLLGHCNSTTNVDIRKMILHEVHIYSTIIHIFISYELCINYSHSCHYAFPKATPWTFYTVLGRWFQALRLTFVIASFVAAAQAFPGM